jgi:hypothetical protein
MSWIGTASAGNDRSEPGRGGLPVTPPGGPVVVLAARALGSPDVIRPTGESGELLEADAGPPIPDPSVERAAVAPGNELPPRCAVGGGGAARSVGAESVGGGPVVSGVLVWGVVVGDPVVGGAVVGATVVGGGGDGRTAAGETLGWA